MRLVDEGLAAAVLERALSRGGDFAELFCEDRRGFTLSIDESRVERPQSGSERGAGIRVIDGEVTRFAHVDGLAEEDLLRAADGLASALGGDATEPLALQAVAAAAAPGDRGRSGGRPGRPQGRGPEGAR